MIDELKAQTDKNQQKKEEKEWSEKEFFQEITKRTESLEKAMKHSGPVRPWKCVALIVLPYVVYWLIRAFAYASDIEVSIFFEIGGIVIAFLISILFTYMLRVRDMRRLLFVTMKLAGLLSFFITAKVKKPLEKEKR